MARLKNEFYREIGGIIIYTTSTAYKTAIKESSRSFECRVTILDKVYRNEDIVDIIIDGNIQPSDGFMIGATTSQSLDLTLLNKGDMVYGTSTIKVEIGLKIGSKIEYIPMGIYNIDDIEKTDYTVKITAFDNMIKFESPYFSSLGDKPTLQQVVNELAAKTGVQFTGTVPAYTVKKLEGFSCREVLGYVASICGGNAVITRDGKFTIVTPKDINYSIGTSNYFDYKREESKYKIGKISCQVGEEVLSKGSLGADSMELEFENPWVTDSILQNIYNKLNGFEYLGYSMKWQGDLSLDVGDTVTITDKKGVVRKHPILSQKFTYTGGLTSEIEAKGENKNKNSFSSSGSTANKVDRVVTDLAIVNKALVDVAHIGDLTAGNIKFDTASGTIMDLQTLLAKHVTGENGQFLNLTTDNVTIANALLKDVIAANISVQDLKAGNIDANRFNIVGSNGNLVIKDNTIQIKDSARVRVQIGKDASGDYSMYVWDKQGNIMFDALGLKSSAIKDKIIRDDMVSDDANINGSKLNISSLITEINKDNTQTLKATKIELDKTGQSLEVSFNSLKTNVDNIQIGGRNLMRYSSPELLEDENISNKWSFGRGSLKVDYLSGNDFFNRKKVYRLILTSGQNNCWANLKCDDDKFFKLEKDKDYYISFKAYIGKNCKGICVKVFTEGDTVNQTIYEYSKTSASDIELDEKVAFKANFTGKAYICIYNNGAINSNNGDSNLLFREIMLGRGNKPTDWSPAPEDIDSKIETNTTSIKAVQGKIETLIKDTTIEKDGKEVKLKDEYSKLDQTVGSITTTVGKHTSTMSDLTTRVETTESSITQLGDKIELKVNANGIISAINMSQEQISIDASKIDMTGNLDLTGTFKCYENGSNKGGAYLYQYGATQKGYRPGIANPVFSSGIWKPDNINQVGYVSVGWTNADKHDVNGCLYMTPIVGGGGRLVYGRTDEKGIGVGESGIIYNKNGGVEYRSFLANRGENGVFSHVFDGGLSCYSIHCNDIYSEGNIRTRGNIYTNNDILFLCSGGNNPTYYLNLRKDGYFFPNGAVQLGTNHAPFYTLVSTLAPQVVSDARQKENITYINDNKRYTNEITLDDMYNYIKDDLRLATYKMKNYKNIDNDRAEIGFIAQDIKDTKIGRYIINTNDDENLLYDIANRIGVLEGALKKAINKIEILEEKIIELESI